MIDDDIIQIDTSQSVTSSQGVPDWVKNTAGWWANDAISETEFVTAIEFLVENGIISTKTHSCDPAEDTNHNGIPDDFENISILKNTQELDADGYVFKNKNWSNCVFPEDSLIGDYKFIESNLENVDFSNSTLIGTWFYNVNLNGADFSNSNLYGVTFLDSDVINVNFNNVDFGPDNSERPFYILSTDGVSTGHTCYALAIPCAYHMVHATPEYEYDRHTQKRLVYMPDEPMIILNLLLVDKIEDKSDNRTTWRHVTNFSDSLIDNSTFDNSDLSNLLFWNSNIYNLDFSNSIYDNFSIINSDLSNIQFLNDTVDNLSKTSFTAENPKYLKTSSDLSLKKFPNPKNIDLDIEFKDAFDKIPINWSMGLDIHDERLYVADTDNHRIIVFDLNSFDPLTSFTSPLQHKCDAVHVFAPGHLFQDDCPLEHRNLPTSSAVLSDKIFVAYGFQNEIQVFDMNGTFLYNFGILGNASGEFNGNSRITTSLNELFVADSKNHRIQIFDSNGTFLREFSTNTNSILDSTPSDLDIYENKIFTIDSTNSSVLIFDTTGNLITKFQVNAHLPETNLSSIDLHENLIFITDSGNHSVLIFDLDGNLITTFGNLGKYYGEFNSPYGIVSNGSNIFISDAYNYRIQIFELFS